MRVDGLNIVLRQRSPWEAADLGMGLVRRHAKVLFASWALATLPVFLLLHLAFTPFGYAWLAGLLFWWLKPVFDRMPIYVLSRGILDQQVSVKDALKQLGWRWSRLWPWLLWRRLHPARSLLMAMDFLEQPEGKQRSPRANLLGRGQANAPGLVWLVGAHLELMLWGSLIVFVLMLVPVEFLDDSLKAMYELMLEEPPPWAEFLQSVAYWLAVLVVEPFYVGAGFALYLNRRTELEAWDIELAFRRLARRAAGAAVAMCLMLGLLMGAASMSTAAATAAEQAEAAGVQIEKDGDDSKSAKPKPLAKSLDALLGEHFQSPDARYQEAVDKVFRDSDLNPKKTEGRWERINPLEPGQKSPPPAWLASLGSVIAFVIENLLWILLGILVIFLLLRSRRWLADWMSDIPPAKSQHESPLLEPKAQLGLPDDIPAAVSQLWREGQSRAALALLYRGAVAALVTRLSQGLPPGATESEVLRSARRLNDGVLSPWLADVVTTWQAAAYAHRLPDTSNVEALLDRWPAARQPGAEPAAEVQS